MAGRPRQPLEVAKVTGADGRSPSRYKNRTNHVLPPVGDAPDWMDAGQKLAWDEMREDLPWLARSDRLLLELAVRVSEQLQKPDAPIGLFAQMRLILSSLGATPVDRCKVSPPRDPEDDPASEFLN